MEKEESHNNITVYYGLGKGKTHAALGRGVVAAGQGLRVNIIQFFKSKKDFNIDYFSRLEPELKYFRFQKSEGSFDSLDDEQKKEECVNMQNGLSFAKKVMTTRGCDVLILDEFLGLVESGLISPQEVETLFACKPPSMQLIITGQVLNEVVRRAAGEVYNITPDK